MLTSVFSNPVVVTAGAGRELWVGDSKYILIVEGDATNGQFALCDLNVTPGTGTPLHIHHTEDEMFYVLDGELSITADGHKSLARPGTFAYVPRGTVHRWQNESAGMVRFLCGVTPAGFEQFFVAIGTPVDSANPTPPAVGPEFYENIARLAPEFNMEVVG